MVLILHGEAALLELVQLTAANMLDRVKRLATLLHRSGPSQVGRATCIGRRIALATALL